MFVEEMIKISLKFISYNFEDLIVSFIRLAIVFSKEEAKDVRSQQ